MKKKLLSIAVLALLIGCGQQPDIDIDADQNQTEQNTTQQTTQVPVVEQNQTRVQPTQTDLTDNTVVSVTTNSNNQELNQNLARALSQKVIHFDFDKYNIRNDQVSIIESIANLLRDTNSNFTVRIEGNCDEWGSDEYNYALGLKRAKAVKQALIDLGVNANKLTIISYGESNPICTAHNKECWAKNRRDNFTLLP